MRQGCRVLIQHSLGPCGAGLKLKQAIKLKWKKVVRLYGAQSNQIFDELAHWEQVLKDTSLARPAPPSL